MKVSLSTVIALPPETVWAEVQTAPLLMHIAWPLVQFVPAGNDPLETFKPGGNYPVKLRLFGVLPFGTQWIVTSTHEPETGVWPKRLRDNGYSALISKWDHWITIAPSANGATDYRDEVDISAGIMTPFIWAFAQVFYRHRQRRWRGLARTLHARRLIATEMATYRASRSANDTAKAWSALERAHIVSQPYLGPHLANHWAMLGFAAAQGDARELVGQVVRLALAPLGALTGRIPIGNIGRATVSAFKPMPIPEDLRDAMTKPDR
jgi:hypothetical protein